MAESEKRTAKDVDSLLDSYAMKRYCIDDPERFSVGYILYLQKIHRSSRVVARLVLSELAFTVDEKMEDMLKSEIDRHAARFKLLKKKIARDWILICNFFESPLTLKPLGSIQPASMVSSCSDSNSNTASSSTSPVQQFPQISTSTPTP